MKPIQHHTTRIRGIELHYVEAGEGPLVILLHGFPEFWFSWRHQIQPLADAGFHVVAPDMRGYNLSGKPKGVHAYHLDELTADVAALIDHLGYESAHIVAHDWGAIVAWFFAMWHPERLNQLAILNVPHPRRFLWGMWRPLQILRSWYVFLFQLPWLPVWAFEAFDFAGLRWAFRNEPLRPDAFSDEDIEAYVEAFRHPGSMRAGIQYYRSILYSIPTLVPRLGRIDAQTLVIWGRHDTHLGNHLAEPYSEDVPNLRVEYLEASHWVQIDAFEDVNRMLLEHLAERRPSDRIPENKPQSHSKI